MMKFKVYQNIIKKSRERYQNISEEEKNKKRNMVVKDVRFSQKMKKIS